MTEAPKMYVVELEPGRWIVDTWRVTDKLENAQKYKTVGAAKSGLSRFICRMVCPLATIRKISDQDLVAMIA